MYYHYYYTCDFYDRCLWHKHHSRGAHTHTHIPIYARQLHFFFFQLPVFLRWLVGCLLSVFTLRAVIFSHSSCLRLGRLLINKLVFVIHSLNWTHFSPGFSSATLTCSSGFPPTSTTVFFSQSFSLLPFKKEGTETEGRKGKGTPFSFFYFLVLGTNHFKTWSSFLLLFSPLFLLDFLLFLSGFCCYRVNISVSDLSGRRRSREEGRGEREKV